MTQPGDYTDHITVTHLEHTSQYHVAWVEAEPADPYNPASASLAFAWNASAPVLTNGGYPDLMLRMQGFLDHVREWFEAELGVTLVQQNPDLIIERGNTGTNATYTPPPMPS